MMKQGMVLSLGLLLALPGLAEEQLEREVEDGLGMAEVYGAEGLGPQEIQETQEVLEKDFPDTAEGAALKARAIISLSRTYLRQGISPMAIKVLQDGIAELTGYRDVEIALREELVETYRELGFAPQAIREYRRIKRLRQYD